MPSPKKWQKELVLLLLVFPVIIVLSLCTVISVFLLFHFTSPMDFFQTLLDIPNNIGSAINLSKIGFWANIGLSIFVLVALSSHQADVSIRRLLNILIKAFSLEISEPQSKDRMSFRSSLILFLIVTVLCICGTVYLDRL